MYLNIKNHYILLCNMDIEATTLYIIGNYYEQLKDYENMKLFYIMSSCLDNIDACMKLADHYRITNNEKEMIKYYSLAQELNNIYKYKHNIYYTILINHNIGLYYRSHEKYDLMDKYYDIYINNTSGNTSELCYDIGMIYYCNHDYELMKKYFMYAIVQNNVKAMCELADYYNRIKEYSLMEQYYLKAIDFNCCKALSEFAFYAAHRNVTINPDLNDIIDEEKKINNEYKLLAEQYYLKIIELKNKYYYANALYSLGRIYEHDKNIPNAINYYKKAVKLRYIPAMHELGMYYCSLKQFDLMEKYLIMAIISDRDNKQYNPFYSSSTDAFERLYDQYTYYKHKSDAGIMYLIYIIDRFNLHNKLKNTYSYTTLFNNDESHFLYKKKITLIDSWHATITKLKRLICTIIIQQFILKYATNILYNPTNGLLFIKNIKQKYDC